jgi:hypothetical protein
MVVDELLVENTNNGAKHPQWHNSYASNYLLVCLCWCFPPTNLNGSNGECLFIY